MGVQINGDTGNISATKADYSGNVTIGGTLTYEDVTNVDSIGIVTARNGIEIGASPGVGASISVDGNAIFSGITTATTLRAPTGIVTSLIANTARATTGIVTTLTATTGIVTSFVTNTASVGAAVTISESGIEASGIGITCANINGTQIGGRRNIIINGAMEVAQRGTSNTAGGDGYFTVDRMYYYNAGIDNDVTKAQGDVASGTSPYSEGFRKSFKLTNGNQTTPGTGDEILIRQNLEAQDLAKCGWNYTSSSSFITLSYWVKSSVAQNFYVNLQTMDGTQYNYVTETGTLSANTWTKVVKTIPGNSNLQFDNNNEKGMHIQWNVYRGTSATGTRPLNAWAAYSSSTRVPDMASTWWINTSATFELTGVQLEVGPQATAFEHRSHGEELALCRRYYYRIGDGTNTYQVVGNGFVGENGSTRCAKIVIHPLTTMRDTPSIEVIGTDAFRATAGGDTMNVTATSNTGGIWGSASTGDIMWMDFGQSGGTTLTNGYGCVVYADNNSANLALSAEL